MKKRAYISNLDGGSAAMMTAIGWETTFNANSPYDLAIFTGGSDIGPWLYGERPIAATYPSPKRDRQEIKVWKMLPKDFPKVGICRGAQLGNVMCGGTLWQDVNKHEYGNHFVKVQSTGEIVTTNSIHHQMCVLTTEAELLASARESTRKESEETVRTYHKTLGTENDWDDPEAFFYEYNNFLAVQFHPEYGHKGSTDLFLDLAKEKFGGLF